MDVKKKIAGVPLWVWGILVIGAIGLGLYLRKRNASNTADTTAVDSGLQTTDSLPIPGTVGGGSGGGGVGGDGTPAPTVDLSGVEKAILDLETTLTGAIANIPIPLSEPSAPIPAPSEPPPPPTVAPTLPASEPPPAPVAAVAPPPSTVATAPPPAAGMVPGATFTWVFAATTFRGERLPAKSVWSFSDKPLFLKHLGARGLTYAGWQANHRPAACRVFGDCG